VSQAREPESNHQPMLMMLVCFASNQHNEKGRKKGRRTRMKNTQKQVLNEANPMKKGFKMKRGCNLRR
jgi:hypothetical protein